MLNYKNVDYKLQTGITEYITRWKHKKSVKLPLNAEKQRNWLIFTNVNNWIYNRMKIHETSQSSLNAENKDFDHTLQKWKTEYITGWKHKKSTKLPWMRKTKNNFDYISQMWKTEYITWWKQKINQPNVEWEKFEKNCLHNWRNKQNWEL